MCDERRGDGSDRPRFFLRHVDRDAAVAALPAAAAYRIADRNVTDDERRSVARLVERELGRKGD